MTDQKTQRTLPDDFLSLFDGTQFQQQPIVPQQQVPAQTSQPAAGMVQIPHAPHAAPQPQPQPPAQPPVVVGGNNVTVPTAPQSAPAVITAPPIAVPPPQAAGPDLQAQINALKAQNDQLRASAEAEAQKKEAERLAALPKQDRQNEQVMARLELMQKQQEEQNRQLVESVKRAQEWQVEAERQEILRQFNGELEEAYLDTSSVQSLHASIPQAQQAYVLKENQMFDKFRQKMGLQQQAAVEGLPPSPSAYQAQGLPTPNAAGAVPSVPATAVPNVPQHMHPQLSRDNVYNYAQAGAGRVFQPQGMANPQPNAQGNYFQPTYPQAGQYLAQVQQPQVNLSGAVPNNAAAAQMAMAAAPTPDPNMRADGSSGAGRGLTTAEAGSAVEAARAAIQASRAAGLSGAQRLGMYESMANRQALANPMGGAIQPERLPQNLPIPSAGDRAKMHPQYLAGARV